MRVGNWYALKFGPFMADTPLFYEDGTMPYSRLANTDLHGHELRAFTALSWPG